ncbi:VENN motif pre-toxin domain-containing protein [Pantoea sp. RRHST58]|uniref:VENN motif pre-toxin domain-containing protein n=1 Tax=Pantoea sp. RRHST58 TaxID=3425183 RepID=UPI003DA10E30
MAHAVAGAVLAQIAGGSAAAGAAGAAGGELAAKAIVKVMYPGTDIRDLTESQKQTVSALSQMAAGLAGGIASDSAPGGGTGAGAGKNAVENNSLGDIAQAQAEGKTLEQKAGEQVKAENERYRKANCGGMSAEACSVKMYTERREALKDTASLGADFLPVVGTLKSAAEAQSALDYLMAAASLIPGERVASGVLKTAEKALAKGDVAEASKLINKASEEIQAVKPLDVGSYKELKDRSVVGDGLEHDHIPSFAAIRQAKENELGRKLTPAEEKIYITMQQLLKYLKMYIRLALLMVVKIRHLR